MRSPLEIKWACAAEGHSLNMNQHTGKGSSNVTHFVSKQSTRLCSFNVIVTMRKGMHNTLLSAAISKGPLHPEFELKQCDFCFRFSSFSNEIRLSQLKQCSNSVPTAVSSINSFHWNDNSYFGVFFPLPSKPEKLNIC